MRTVRKPVRARARTTYNISTRTTCVLGGDGGMAKPHALVGLRRCASLLDVRGGRFLLPKHGEGAVAGNGRRRSVSL